jgi:hypothetical protein
MSALWGVVGAGALFALLGFAATRVGSRLEGVAGCHADPNSLESCTLHEGCDGCGEEKSASGWWPDGKVTHGDRR